MGTFTPFCQPDTIKIKILIVLSIQKGVWIWFKMLHTIHTILNNSLSNLNSFKPWKKKQLSRRKTLFLYFLISLNPN